MKTVKTKLAKKVILETLKMMNSDDALIREKLNESIKKLEKEKAK